MMVSGGNAGDEGELIADINVTPLVDITLVLLVVFMVTAPMIMNTPSIKVELPKAATGEETTKTPLGLTLQRQPAGGYSLYLNGDKMDEPNTRVRIARLISGDRELQVIIAADRGIAYGDVIHIVDLVKGLGVHRFALNIDAD
jgi:biopolymer transport protein ExbD